jgi:hypothetical protein
LILATATLLLQSTIANAVPSLTDSVVAQYPGATNLESCGTCHTSFTSATGLNPYGAAFGAAFTGDPAAAFLAIEEADSDGDGTSNGDEINIDAGFMPGWTCQTYGTADSPPADLADYVDPTNIGCSGVTTTTITTITTTTTVTATSTSTTTTTVPSGEATCADPVSPFGAPVATDCLFILNAAVGAEQCEACICDAIGTNGVNSTDALLCLRVAVGESLPLDCPPCDGGSTTTTTGAPTTTTTGLAPTTTTTTSTMELATTTTTTTTAPESTTTTTIGG